MLSGILATNPRAPLAGSTAVSLLVHLGAGLALITSLRVRASEPPKAPTAPAVELDLSDEEPGVGAADEPDGLGDNPSTPTEIAASPHRLQLGPDRAASSRAQWEARKASGVRSLAARPRREELETQHSMRKVGAEPPSIGAPPGDLAGRAATLNGKTFNGNNSGKTTRQPAGGIPGGSPGTPRDVAQGSVSLSTSREDPLDRVLRMRAERDPLTNSAGERMARTGGETTVIASGPAFAEADRSTDGLGSGPGGRGRPDRSSPARLGGPVWWRYCRWPHEADALPIRHATAKLVVDVTPDGHATVAHVVEDLSGLGPGAQRCAMAHLYVSARDRDGLAVAGTTLPFVVQFDR